MADIKIVYAGNLDLTTYPNPVSGSYIIAIDLDGHIKKKNPSGTIIDLEGAGTPNVVKKTFADSPYTITGAEDFILIDSTLGPVQIIALAANNTLAKSKFPVIKDAFGTGLINDIYITPNGADTIDTVNANYSIPQTHGQLGSIRLVSNGTNGYSIT